MRRVVAVSLVLVLCSSIVSASPVAAADVVLRPPTSAEVERGFDLAFGPYGPGNRGIDYLTAIGDPIIASGPGVVIFAGPVGGSLHITIDHGSGLLTSYSFVDRILVTRGDRVGAGEKIAISGEGFHFGTRIEGRYVDPEELFGIRTVRVRLVPWPDRRDREAWLDIVSRSELLEFREVAARRKGRGILDMVGSLRRVLASVPLSPFRWLDPAERLSELIDMAMVVGVLAQEVRPEVLASRSWGIVLRAIDDPECTEGSVAVAPPPERRIAVVVDGLDSSSSEPGSMAKLDLASHGYEPGDIIRFSYNGGRVDSGPGADKAGWASELTTTAYSGSDTRGSVADNVSDLEVLLAEIASAQPDVEIDIYGHSLGGLITRLAVAEVAGGGGAVDVGVAVTFGAPNRGVPLAEVVQTFRLTTPGTVLAIAADVVAPDSLLVAEVVDDVSPSGYVGDMISVAFPPGVHAVSIGARGDLVVPGLATEAPGAANVLIGGSFGIDIHGDLPGMAEADREVALALADMAPACESAWGRLADGGVSFGIETLQRAAAVGLAYVAIETAGG